ncbi:CidA/LrgA family protein [Paraburkholderia sp. UCT31]|uniref:CidA/LrgA family protein n=1 Tax=Paraburkholderia sp. UCT31 TaxID=2615209 RepID=UPI00223B6189|nr:CidA/LrgA family protein [Paraburkholderia sp. UCT31]
MRVLPFKWAVLTARVSRLTGRAAQAIFFVIVFLVASKVVALFDLPVSGGILGLFCVLALLLAGLLDSKHVEGGATWLLGELVLFFIPSVVALTKYVHLFREFGLQLLISISAGTVLVMTATAATVHIVGLFSKKSFPNHRTLSGKK